MSILQRLRSDLQRALHEHQAKALLHVIRQRLGELTLGELREILASKIGRGLEALRIVELTGGTGEVAPAAALPGKTKGAAKQQAKAKGAAKKQAKAKGAAKQQAKAKGKAGSFGSELIEKVWQTLTSAKAAMTSGELRAALGGSKATMYRAVSELVRAGKVETAGKPARYSVRAEGEARQEAAAQAPAAQAATGSKKQGKKAAGKKAAGKKAAGKKAAGKKAAKQGAGKKAAKAKTAAKSGEAGKPAAKAAEVSARTSEGRADYDAQVIAALREAGDWIGATRVRDKVGGTDNQLRIALHRLIADGKVTRRGARNSTEYRLGG